MITKEEIEREFEAFAGTYNSAPMIALLNKLEAERNICFKALQKIGNYRYVGAYCRRIVNKANQDLGD